jgi:hypothetical protein
MRFGNDAWVQIKRVQFGYGGEGPGNAHSALRLAEIPDEVAHTVFYSDGINLLIEDNGLIHEKDFGVTPPTMPKLATDGSLVVVIHGSRWDEAGEEKLCDWIDYLDKGNDTSLLWKNGPRRISLYPLREDAQHDGFDCSRDGVPQLVIEQGDLQLWLVEFVEDDPAVWIPRQFRRYLEVLGAIPQTVIENDDAPAFRRWLTSHTDRRPRVIGLGDGKVTRVPKLGKI